jgi:steroid 5-alpha reductase family enzyme
VRIRDASIADAGWEPGVVLLAWIDFVLSGLQTRRGWLVAGLITVWGARLCRHIVRRSRGKGEDPRYTAMRTAHRPAFWWRSLFVVFWLQGVILWVVALPLLGAVTARQPFLMLPDLVGLLLFIVGFAFEAVGDFQLERFRADPANRGKVLNTGLWRYTRHPNYFGDATM